MRPGFKSFLWKVLKSAKTKRGDKTTVVDFSPKAITTNELYLVETQAVLTFLEDSERDWGRLLMFTKMWDTSRKL